MGLWADLGARPAPGTPPLNPPPSPPRPLGMHMQACTQAHVRNHLLGTAEHSEQYTEQDYLDLSLYNVYKRTFVCTQRYAVLYAVFLCGELHPATKQECVEGKQV